MIHAPLGSRHALRLQLLQRSLQFWCDEGQRELIWRGIFPEAAPLDGVDYGKLARLNVPGGSIRNIALNVAGVRRKSRREGVREADQSLKASAHGDRVI